MRGWLVPRTASIQFPPNLGCGPYSIPEDVVVEVPFIEEDLLPSWFEVRDQTLAREAVQIRFRDI